MREHTAKMTTILIKILVESFAFNRRRKKASKNDKSKVKNKTIADCIKLNNLKISQFYVGNLRVTTLCSAWGEGKARENVPWRVQHFDGFLFLSLAVQGNRRKS
jgi:hypothetical protein